MKACLYLVLLLCLVPVLLFSTDVSGAISGVWSVDNSPYNLVGDANVPEGQSLQIMPGVIIRAMGNFRITAVGTISAVGTETDSIRFENGLVDTNALWKGVRLENTTLSSNFSYCYIENGEYGVNSINSPVQIHYSRFYKNTKGIHAYAIGSTNPATVNISNSKIEFSGENGILISQNSNTSVSFCDISRNGTSSTYRGAIQLSNQSAGGSNDPQIFSNHIHHNHWQGITAWDIVGANAINPFIYDNVIEYNLTGIYLLNASGYVHNNLIRYNFIPGDMNSGAGVMVSGATSEPYFEQNEITHNFTGFYITNNAIPCLGDLGIYHAWAQGENVIRNNVDAQGTPHSVVCATYPQNANIIKAENNRWDSDDPIQIALLITDGNDDPALPMVDFDPFLIENENTMVIGDYVYHGNQTLENLRVQLVSVQNGVVIHQAPISAPGLITLETFIPEPFYVVVVADVVQLPEPRFGIAGNLQNPSVFNPEGQSIINVGTIEVTDLMPASYERIGAPLSIGELETFPLFKGFFVYQFDSIDWLHREGDYIYLLQHTRRINSEIFDYELPPGAIWMKVANLYEGDSWLRTEIIDPEGTIGIYTVTNHMVLYPPLGMPFPNEVPLLVQDGNGGSPLLQELYNFNDYPPTIHRAIYDGDYLARMDRLNYFLVQNDFSLFPLFEGNTWHKVPLPPPHFPSLFSMRLDFMMDSIHFYWQAPAFRDTLWTHYRIYKNDQILVEIPFSQRDFHYENAGILNLPVYFYVVATDGVNESARSEYAAIGPSSAEDNLSPAPIIKAGPNPFVLSKSSVFKLEIDYATKADTRINIFNIKGQLVNTSLIRNESCIKYAWNGKDRVNQFCATGIYFVEISRDGQSPLRRKIALIK